ncbi:unnamed protein product [Lampetra planeri]
MPAEHLGTVRTRLLLQLPLLPMKTAATAAAAAAAPLTVVLVSTIWAHDAHFNESATLGSNVTLPCYFEPRKANNVIRVLWKLNDYIPILYCKNNSHCDDKRATLRGDLSVGNASIAIAHLQPEDVGNYTCEIICDSEGTWNKTTVQLIVPEQQVSRHDKQGRNVVIGVCVASVLAIVAAGLAIRAKRRRNLARAGGGDVHPALMSQHPGGQPASVVHIHIFSGDGGVGGEKNSTVPAAVMTITKHNGAVDDSNTRRSRGAALGSTRGRAEPLLATVTSAVKLQLFLPESVDVTEGENVTLTCSFSSPPTVSSGLYITWLTMPTGYIIYDSQLGNPWLGIAEFAGDKEKGDCSLRLLNVSTTLSPVFKCDIICTSCGTINWQVEREVKLNMTAAGE